MSLVEIEAAIEQLPKEEAEKLYRWIDDFRFRQWDRQIEEDVDAGRLDTFLSQARAEIRQGLAQPYDTPNAA